MERTPSVNAASKQRKATILRDTKTIFSRSRLGLEPLLYAPFDGGVVLGRTYQDIFNTGLIPKSWRREALVDFLSVGTVVFPNGGTFFDGIYETPPGYDLKISGSETIVIARDLLPEATEELGEEAIPMLREMLIESLEKSLDGAGLCLSGGLDSSSLAAAWSLIGQPRCFVYGAPGSIDRELALETAKALKIEPFLLEPEEIKLEDLKEMLRILEIPIHIPGGPFPQFILLAAMARESIKIALSGQGGDELFCGYPWHFPLAMKKLRISDSQMASKLEAIHEENPPFPPMDLRLSRRNFTRTSSWITLNDGGACAVLGFSRQEVSEREGIRFFAADLDNWDVLRRHGLTVRSLRFLLHYDHRLANHLGLQAKAPLLDDRVVDLVSRFRLDFLYGEGLLKYPLRRLFPETPEKVRFQIRKTGFWQNTPNLPDLKLEVCRMIETTALSDLVVSPEAVKKMTPGALWRFFSVGTLMEFDARVQSVNSLF